MCKLLMSIILLVMCCKTYKFQICPPPCSCKDGKADCSSRGLATVPKGFASETRIIDLGSNQIKHIEYNAFGNFNTVNNVTPWWK